MEAVLIRVRLARPLALLALLMALASGACASRTAVPRPFPGAPTPSEPGPPPSPGPGPLPSPEASKLVTTALSLKGIQYRNGGSEPTGGFDCSGLVQWVFAQHGTAVPRDTRAQYDAGRKIDKDEIQPGDLIFFETVGKGPSHVGIALGGDEFVHAPSSRGVVRVENYKTSEYWSRRWIGARRIVLPTGS